jgi:hypothetical protein
LDGDSGHDVMAVEKRIITLGHRQLEVDALVTSDIECRGCGVECVVENEDDDSYMQSKCAMK